MRWAIFALWMAHAFGATYIVTDDTTWNSVPWCTLAADDIVNISPKAARAHYFQKLDLTASGTAGHPITVQGIRGAGQSASDLVVDGSVANKVTSGSYTFVADDVGELINVTGGAGWTVLSYQILSVSSGAALLTCPGMTATCAPAALGTTGGVWNMAGPLPVIDGANALTSANMCPYGSQQFHEAFGVIFIGYPSGAGNQATQPANITVSKLRATGGLTTNNFTASAGTTQAYQAGVAGAFVQAGLNIILDGLELTVNQNGTFANYNTGTSPPLVTTNITLQYTHLWNNGSSSSFLFHQAYYEANGCTYTANWFDWMALNAEGVQLKTRCSGIVIRYNWIEPGGRTLDIVEAQNGCAAGGGYPGLCAQPTYVQTFVYGNVFRGNQGNPSGLFWGGFHYGYDSDVGNDRAGTLVMYHNTGVLQLNSSSLFYATVYDLVTNSDTADDQNNILYATNAGATDTTLRLNNDTTVGGCFGTINFLNNWVSAGWVASTAGSPQCTINGTSNFTSPVGNASPFNSLASGTYTLPSNSTAKAIGSALNALVTSNAYGLDFTPTQQMLVSAPGVPTLTARSASGLGADVGAFQGPAPSSGGSSAFGPVKQAGPVTKF